MNVMNGIAELVLCRTNREATGVAPIRTPGGATENLYSDVPLDALGYATFSSNYASLAPRFLYSLKGELREFVNENRYCV
jgi:hypothetical protein